MKGDTVICIECGYPVNSVLHVLHLSEAEQAEAAEAVAFRVGEMTIEERESFMERGLKRVERLLLRNTGTEDGGPVAGYERDDHASDDD